MWLYLCFLWSQLSLPVLSHSAHHLPGSSSAAHLSLLKDTNYTSLHHGGPFHSNTLQGHSSLAEVPMWFQPVSDGPFHAWPEVHGWTTAHSPIISSLLSSVSVCVHTAPHRLLTPTTSPIPRYKYFPCNSALWGSMRNGVGWTKLWAFPFIEFLRGIFLWIFPSLSMQTYQHDSIYLGTHMVSCCRKGVAIHGGGAECEGTEVTARPPQTTATSQ